jgi:Fic family protein
MTIAFVPSRLANLEVFRETEIEELRRLVTETPLHRLLQNRAWREASAIDFAYTSGLVEGNTYSRKDAIALLTAGNIAPRKGPQETQMLLNLRDAHALILDNAHEIVQTGLAGYREIHTLLMRRILPAEQLGATRATRYIRISGTDYMPPDGAAYLDRRAAEILAGLGHVANPFDACLYAASNLS